MSDQRIIDYSADGFGHCCVVTSVPLLLFWELFQVIAIVSYLCLYSQHHNFYMTHSQRFKNDILET